jgi:hypothetical protein
MFAILRHHFKSSTTPFLTRCHRDPGGNTPTAFRLDFLVSLDTNPPASWRAAMAQLSQSMTAFRIDKAQHLRQSASKITSWKYASIQAKSAVSQTFDR